MASYFLISGARAALNEREAPGKVVTNVPSKPKKTALSAPFLDASRQNFENRHCHFLDAISFTGENFTKHNFIIFSKMYGTYFHD